MNEISLKFVFQNSKSLFVDYWLRIPPPRYFECYFSFIVKYDYKLFQKKKRIYMQRNIGSIIETYRLMKAEDVETQNLICHDLIYNQWRLMCE